MKKIIVVLHSGTFYELEEKEADNLSKVINEGKSKFVKIKDNLVAVSSFANLIDADEYYRQHPQKKQSKEPFYKNFNKLEPLMDKRFYSKERHESRLKRMKDVFKKRCGEMNEGQQMIYNKMEETLNRIGG